MRNSALHVLLIFVGVPFLAIALIYGFDFYMEVTKPPLPWPPPDERIQHPKHHRWAEAALNRYQALPLDEREKVRAELTAAFVDLDDWLKDIDKRGFAVLCLGEYHDDYTRRFIAERIIPAVHADRFLLEATPDEVREIIEDVDDGDEIVELLNADVARLIRAVKSANPEIAISGIEETPDQRETRAESGEGSRETSIEKNLRETFTPGQRHIVLFGAFHCANQWQWLYWRLLNTPLRGASGPVLSIRVAREHIEAPIESFVFFLDKIGLGAGHLAIPDTTQIPDLVKSWFPFLKANELNIYPSMIIFRPSAV